MKTRKFVLSEKEMPEHWYNITASMTNKPLPSTSPRDLTTHWSGSVSAFVPYGTYKTGSYQ